MIQNVWGRKTYYKAPSKNPSKKHLLLENLLRTPLRSVRLHDPLGVRPSKAQGQILDRDKVWILAAKLPNFTNPGTTPITILAVDSDHGLSFAGEETRTMVLSGSNATPLVSRYSCRATLVSHFSPYVFAVSHENRATPLKVSQKRPCRTLLGGVSHLKLAMHIS